MNYNVLTQTSGWLGPFAKVIGTIFNYLYKFFAHFGIENVGLCIVLLVIVVRVIMIPLTIKQQKFTKMNSIIQPEIEVINKKYAGKKDQESLMAKNQEMTEIYNKYGVSPSGGCLNLLIQLPIMFGLYQVIMRVPAYVPQLKAHYTNIINSIGTDKLLSSSVIKDAAKSNHVKLSNIDGNTEAVNKLVDTMFKFNSDNWSALKDAFAGNADVITKNMHKIEHANNLFGMNLTLSPQALVNNKVYIAILIPILAALTQFISSKLMMGDQGSDDDNPMAASLKSMTYIMPLFSLFMCWTLASCIGVYWIASTVITTIIQLCVTKYYDSIPLDQLVEINKQKAAAKRAKLGIDDAAMKKATSLNTKKMGGFSEKMNKIYEENKRLNDELNGRTTNSETDTTETNETAEEVKTTKEPKAGSIASKAKLADKYKK